MKVLKSEFTCKLEENPELAQAVNEMVKQLREAAIADERTTTEVRYYSNHPLPWEHCIWA